MHGPDDKPLLLLSREGEGEGKHPVKVYRRDTVHGAGGHVLPEADDVVERLLAAEAVLIAAQDDGDRLSVRKVSHCAFTKS